MDIETTVGTAIVVALATTMALCGESRANEPFRDELQSGGQGPQMVAIPAGTFTMGCTPDDSDCDEWAQPTREVTLASFALGVTEVTFDEWNLCGSKGGCDNPRHMGYSTGRGNRPFLARAWTDAGDYVAWLSRETGEEYRLPTESEWEYAARAGTTTKYWWGDDIGENRASCRGCGGQWDNSPKLHENTAPVGSFDANPWGLHDMHGNVWEWVEDCWHGTYDGAPTDGSAWLGGGDCEMRVLRGGSWFSHPRGLSAAYRDWRPISGKVRRNDLHHYGFRVARTITP